jgi:tetratricopeptide (TPR) repeat protein
MEMLFAQGAATFEAFDGDASPDQVSRPAVPPHVKERFLAHVVSTLSWPKRMLAAAAGMAGDGPGGIQLLEIAASAHAETASDASLVLMIVYNRLLRLNTAATAVAASRADLAVTDISDALHARVTFVSPAVLGEPALWFYTRGIARRTLGHAEAVDDFRQCLAASPREWVRARAHLNLGAIELYAGRKQEAAAELQAAMRYGRLGGDTTTVDHARRLLRLLRRVHDPG